MRRSFRLAAAVSLFLHAPFAQAQTLDERRAQADALFGEGQQLMAAGQVQAACEKLEESERTDPKLGRLLNVAYCHEKLGRTATAWSEYNQAAAMAVQGKQPEREKFARDRAGDLAAKLSFVRLDIQAGVELGAITVDAKPVPRDQWAVPFPIDPGTHNLSFEAPGHKTRTQPVSVQDTQTVRVAVEPLEVLPAESASPPAPAPTAPSAAPASSPQSSPTEPSPAPPAKASNGLRTAGWIVGGVGVAALGAGVGLALRAMSLKGQADGDCQNKLCTAAGTSLISDAKTSANIATAGFAVGLAGIAGGVTLILLPARSAAPASARLTPYMGPDGAGFWLDGAW
jgi:hypothetical protein